MKKYALVFIFTLSLSSILFSQNIPSYIPKNGLVAWYPFTGNAIDSSGNGYNGTVYGATLTTDRFGNPNSAYFFGEVTNPYNSGSLLPNYIKIPNLHEDSILSYTISGWFKKSTNSINREGTIFCGDQPCNGPGGLRVVVGSANNLFFITEFDSCNDQWETSNYLQTNPVNYADNKWHHFAAIFNATAGFIKNTNLLLYIDGIKLPQFNNVTPDSISNVIAPINNGSLPTILGNAQGSYYNFTDGFPGSIDDICVWNRALTVAEVQQLYNSSGTIINVQSPSITSFSPTSGGTGTSVVIKGQNLTGATGVTFGGTAASSFTFDSSGNIIAVVGSGSTGSVQVTTPNGTAALDTFTYIAVAMDSTFKPNIPSYVPKNGLVAWYPFTGNAIDSSGKGNNGTVHSAKLTSDRFGKPNMAYSYSGVSTYDSLTGSNIAGSYIEIPYSPIFDNRNYSFSFWVLSLRSTPAPGGPQVNQGIISRNGTGGPFSTPASADNWVIFEDAGNIAFGSAGNAGSPTTGAEGETFPDVTGNWHHVVFSVSDSICNTYLDGNLKQTVIYNTPISYKNQVTRIGLSLNTYWRAFQGSVDDIGVWNRALTVAEVQQLYKAMPIIYDSIPSFTSIHAGNKKDTLNWQIDSSNNLSTIIIFRDTLNPPLILLDSVSGLNTHYIDSMHLKLNQKYYYRLESVFQNGSNYNSTVDSATPFNIPPIAARLTNKTFENAGENNYARLAKSAAGSFDPDGEIIHYSWFVNDSLVDNTDSVLIYNFPQGQSQLTLKVMDNDSAVSVSTCTINLSAFVKRYNAGILAGITALNTSNLYVADSSFDPVNGASINRIDSLGNIQFQLIVGSKIYTTPSVSSDSSIFITSGSSLNGFSSSGAPLWPTIALGGLSYVTPTIDSSLHSLYFGVSNRNFFAIDYKTGKVIWNAICDAPISSSAVITGDRKLVFSTQKGTVYGFNLAIDTTSTVVPQWKSGIAGQISTSPAVDSKNDLYFGTVTGNLVKLSLDSNGVVTTIWTASLGSSIQSSPVIDANGYVYVGNLNGQFYKIDPNTGSVIWTYQSKGSILATPSISDYGYIHIADNTGFVSCLSQAGSVLWKYQDSTAVTANLLSINGMTYIGTIGGKLIGFYDNPNTSSVNTSISYQFKNQLKNKGGGFAGLNRFSSKELLNSLFFAPPPSYVPLVSPIWGTYQGNYKRTGSKSFNCSGLAIPSINWNGNQFSTNLTNVTYQWFLNSSPVSGANGETLKPASTGNYQVEVTYGNGCQTISNSYTLVVTAVNNPSSTSREHIAKLYPNPARSEVIVQFEQLPATEITIQLVTANGQIIKQITSTNQSTIIPLIDAGSGTYYLRILGKDYNQTQQLLIIR